MKTDTIEITPQAEELAKDAESMLTQYRDYKIISNPEYVSAADILKKIKAKAGELEELRKSMTRPLDESKKRIMDFFRKPLEFLAQAESIIKKSMLIFQQDQEKIRQAQEKKLKEQQEKEAEKLLKKAEKAEAKGNLEKAEELKDQATQTQAVSPIVAPSIEKVGGIATKTIWKFRVVNVDLIPREYMIPDEQKLGAIARATKGTLKVAGVEFYSEETIAAGK